MRMREHRQYHLRASIVRRLGAGWIAASALLVAPTACNRMGEVEGLVARGVSLASEGKTGDALAHFDRALDLDPDHPAALVNGGLAALIEGRAPVAKARFERYLSENGDDVLPRVYLAHALVALDDREGAIAALQRAVGLGFGDLDALTDGSFRALQTDIRFIQLASLVAQRTGRRAPVDDRGRILIGGLPVRSLSGPSLPSACDTPPTPPSE